MTAKEAERRLNIKVDIIPIGSKNRPGLTLNATHVTIHNTANVNAGANAKMHAKYVKGADAVRRRVSWHYTVDDHEVYKHLPLSEQGYHAGTTRGNSKSVGIEVCMNSDGDQAKTDDRAALLVAYVCFSLNIPVNNVVTHKSWSGKNCPSLFLANRDAGWRAFVKNVRSYHAQFKSAPVTATKTTLSELKPARSVAEIYDGKLAKIKANGKSYITNARPDTPDFRDRMYMPSLRQVPPEMPLAAYKALKVPILDQGQEGACTGFALATIVNFLQGVKGADRKRAASPWMMYEMARKYDEWAGESYSGSSARGAMKAWHKHGVCSSELWKDGSCVLTKERALEAATRPLGAYFRVNHKDLVAMHTAINEVGVLYATAVVHEGWSDPDPRSGRITKSATITGGHAFVIVGYDGEGFWIQNSWGPDWGKGGYAHVSYADWLDNGSDVWVARLGVPIELESSMTADATRSSADGHYEGYASVRLRRHVVSIGNDGQLSSQGAYGTDVQDLEGVVQSFLDASKTWKKRRILLYAHGGLVEENHAIGLLSRHADWLMDREVYPVSFVWHSGLFDTITNIVQDAVRKKRPEGFIEKSMEFLEDRFDDLLEQVARIPGKAVWDEMKENARAASAARDGGARLFLEKLVDEVGRKGVEVHLVGHSAGAIFHGPLVQLAATPIGQPVIGWPPLADPGMDGPDTGLGLDVATCTLWAPACRTRLFKDAYMALYKQKLIKRLAVFALTDTVERKDNCIGVYKKSLLYLVSNAFENPYRIPVLRPDGAPILGMERFINADPEIKAFFARGNADLVLSPSDGGNRPGWASQSKSHGGFDEDDATLYSTFERIVGPDVARSGVVVAKKVSRAGTKPRPRAKRPARAAIKRRVRAKK